MISYLKELECDSTLIKQNNGQIIYEFDDHDIASAEVRFSISRLWRAGCKRIWKDKEANTISFELWYRTMGEVDCGIACTFDNQSTPKTAFQVCCEEVGDGWYYYFDDYEEYRAHPSDYEENQPW